MTRTTTHRKNLLLGSLVAVLALLLFAGAASAFTYNSNDYSVTPTGSIAPGTTVTASMIVSYSDGTTIPNQLNLDSDLIGVSWTVVRNPGQANAMTFHPTYPYAYVSNFDLYESSGSVSVKVTVTGRVPSDAAGKSIYPLIISESGGSGTVYDSPALNVAGSTTTLTPTPIPTSTLATVIIPATTVETAVPTQSIPVPTIATQTSVPIPTPAQTTTTASVSKSTFEPTARIIIISALVVIIAGTVIIVRLTKRPKKTEKPTNTTIEQKEIHVHVNGNVYSDVGVVASDNAIVNRPSITTDAKKKCPYCGAELEKNDKFCSKCGKQL